MPGDKLPRLHTPATMPGSTTLKGVGLALQPEVVCGLQLRQVTAPRGLHILGGVAWPGLLSPQQTIFPSVFTQQVWVLPALASWTAGLVAVVTPAQDRAINLHSACAVLTRAH